eukprot:CAMPEP_0203971164 /NCGR_PEP_ID=MMETSP0359-20131031/98335_1 /ASSEMBLY_ACC=CAM_ASM_000338 /TAXON_ID=268821 /ORGANISM="Scrippsiella Hangoei, Strain SHTV-5" /LENGTH=330 /DNA_ID=CAMNT_0050909131 /DNA_START=62 /DNA_END=1054 /DNA_ORIENTATION=+
MGPKFESTEGVEILADQIAIGEAPSPQEPPRSRQGLRARPVALTDFRSSPCQVHIEEKEDMAAPQLARPNTHAGILRRPFMLSLTGSFSSLAGTGQSALDHPGTPLPERQGYRQITSKVEVIMFDFDGTLTATPGDRQVRSRKRAEICERAPFLQARLQALRDSGCVLGIISKSSEMTIREALLAGGLLAYFDAPIIAKAVGFEGKIGFIQDLARRGLLRRPGDRRPGPACNRILLVDDDVLELERAGAGGLQTYAAPSEGGLQDEDFDTIEASLKLSHFRPRPVPGRCSVAFPLASLSSDDGSARHSLSGTSGGKWRNLILFSGECFEG